MSIPAVEQAIRYRTRLAIAATDGTLSYSMLRARSGRVAGGLLAGQSDLRGGRVAFLVPPSCGYAAVQWGIWRAGGVAVPLCLDHPRPELEYVIADCGAQILVAAPEQTEQIQPIAEERRLQFLSTREALQGPESPLPEVSSSRPAMIVYTSGTTGGPKGVVTTHDNIRAQIESLVAAWEWRAEDRALLVLPLHHIHGIINVLGCALWSGAVCEMLPRFDAVEVWRRFVDSDISLFMAVPTVYAKLVSAWESADSQQRKAWSRACRKLRLMVSGSAALPVRLLERWREISGHVLLERYGMTEIGMALSNPLHGSRVPGHVGTPLPGIEVRRVDANGDPVAPDEPGEIEVRGAAVFREYWGRPQETRQAFRGEGWFRTGDIAVVEQGSYRLLGRQSVDIIKTGGYKVSALEIEEVLREHAGIAECAVIGVPDDEWGERVLAVVVPHEGAELTLEGLRSWSKERLAVYKAPSRLKLVSELPRNPMGKVTKPELKRRFATS